MNREPKFRAWDKKAKRMSPPFVLFGEFTLLGGVHSWQREAKIDGSSLGRLIDLEILQFIGRHDKNGKEIYDGYILIAEPDKPPMVVKWSEKFASWCLYRDGWAFAHWFGEACDPEQCEVIGNIYENPELMEDKK